MVMATPQQQEAIRRELEPWFWWQGRWRRPCPHLPWSRPAPLEWIPTLGMHQAAEVIEVLTQYNARWSRKPTASEALCSGMG